jgi:hypothetical protein
MRTMCTWKRIEWKKYTLFREIVNLEWNVKPNTGKDCILLLSHSRRNIESRDIHTTNSGGFLQVDLSRGTTCCITLTLLFRVLVANWTGLTDFTLDLSLSFIQSRVVVLHDLSSPENLKGRIQDSLFYHEIVRKRREGSRNEKTFSSVAQTHSRHRETRQTFWSINENDFFFLMTLYLSICGQITPNNTNLTLLREINEILTQSWRFDRKLHNLLTWEDDKCS